MLYSVGSMQRVEIIFELLFELIASFHGIMQTFHLNRNQKRKIVKIDFQLISAHFK